MIEAVVIGRVGVDLTPPISRTTMVTTDSFVRAVGGFAGNIATGLARLGIGTAVVSAVGDDGHGEYVRTFLAGEGVDVEAVIIRPGSRTQVAFFEVWPPERFPVTFYRLPPAPETQLTIADLPTDILDSAPIVIVSGTLLADEPARSMTLRVLEDRAASRRRQTRSRTILDLDWRPTLWDDPADAPALMARAAGLSDIVIGSDVEFAAAGLFPEIASEGRPELTVLKHGPDGVSLFTRGKQEDLPGIEIEVLCGIGAGDALTAAFTAGLLRGVTPRVALERGNAAGAIVASRLMCSTAMPTASEIDRFMPDSAPRSGEAIQ